LCANGRYRDGRATIAALHAEGPQIERRDVSHRIALNGDDVGETASFE
jgi:hypothetical protein